MMLVPIVLIAASIVSVLRYTTLVQTSISSRRQVLTQLITSDQLGTTEILKRTDFTNIPNGNALVMWYLAAFLSAETSLVVMALAEYVESSHD